jgi:hypothetical protein
MGLDSTDVPLRSEDVQEPSEGRGRSKCRAVSRRETERTNHACHAAGQLLTGRVVSSRYLVFERRSGLVCTGSDTADPAEADSMVGIDASDVISQLCTSIYSCQQFATTDDQSYDLDSGQWRTILSITVQIAACRRVALPTSQGIPMSSSSSGECDQLGKL